MVLVTYDVDFSHPAGAKRLRKVAKICENFGIRVQNSVFEMNIDSTQLTELKIQINSVIDKQLDSVRFYKLPDSAKLTYPKTLKNPRKYGIIEI